MGDTKEFKPTPAMLRAKALLHKALRDDELRSLSPESAQLPRAVSPTPMPLLRKWIKDSPEFWPWLLTPVDSDASSLRAKELAYAHLVEVLELSIKRDDGSIDHDVLKAKQKATDMLLAKDKPMVQIANNTLHASGPGSLPPGSVPRGLRGKNTGMIASRVEALAAASDASSDVVDVPSEDVL